MGWFDEQIKERKKSDEDTFQETFVGISDAVTGARVSAALADERGKAKDAIDEILSYYHVKTRNVPDNIKDTNEQLEYLMRPYGIMRRNVRLEKGWYREAFGAMLGVKKADGTVVAFIPSGLSGYSYFDAEKGKRIRVTHRNEGLFEEEAIAFYKPFPLKKINSASLLKYIAGILSPADYIIAAVSVLVVTLVGMFSPKLNQLLFGIVAESGDIKLLSSIAVFMACVTISAILFGGVKELL